MVAAMTDAPYQPRRSLIFTDGMRPEMFAKALESGADMVCVDLEDAIAPEHKDQARDFTLPLFAKPEAGCSAERRPHVEVLDQGTLQPFEHVWFVVHAQHATARILF